MISAARKKSVCLWIAIDDHTIFQDENTITSLLEKDPVTYFAFLVFSKLSFLPLVDFQLPGIRLSFQDFSAFMIPLIRILTYQRALSTSFYPVLTISQCDDFPAQRN
jgi:hypothetical protein